MNFFGIIKGLLIRKEGDTTATTTVSINSNITTPTALTLPEGDDQLVGRISTDDLSNKTLQSDTVKFQDLSTPANELIIDLTNTGGYTTTIGAFPQAGNIVLSLPATSTQLIGTDTTDDVSNKTFVTTATPFQANIPSTSTTDGTIVVTGGVGISGAVNIGGNTVITGNLTVTGSTTTINTTDLVVLDKNIVINDQGTVASSEGAGITVDRTDGEAIGGSIIYARGADDNNTRFKVGPLGAEAYIVDISTTQTITNKEMVVASNTITTAASGNLVATELNAALAELQTDVDTRADRYLSNLISPTTVSESLIPVSTQELGTIAKPWKSSLSESHIISNGSLSLGGLVNTQSAEFFNPVGNRVAGVALISTNAGNNGNILIGSSDRTDTSNSAAIYIQSGDQGGAAGDSGLIRVETGDSDQGDSGSMFVGTGQSIDTLGRSGTLTIASGNTSNAAGANNNTGAVSIASGTVQTSTNGVSGNANFGSGSVSQGSGNSGTVGISSGGAISGNSGDINLTIGASSSGTRGSINLDALAVNVTDFASFESTSLPSQYWGTLPALVLDGKSADAISNGAVGIIFDMDEATGNEIFISGNDLDSGGNNTSGMTIKTGSHGGTGTTGSIYMLTGNQNNATGDSGGIDIVSGESVVNSGAVRINSGGGTTSSGVVELKSGGSGSASGDIDLISGGGGAGTSGNIKLTVGSATTQGDIQFLKTGIANTIGDIWTATSVDGKGYWATPTVGADINLSNITATAIPVNLIPDTAATIQLGSPSLPFNKFNGTGVALYSAANTLKGHISTTGSQTPLGVSTDVALFSTAGNVLGIFSANDSTADVNPTGSLHIETGNKTAGTGDSGLISIVSGDSQGGDTGSVTVASGKNDFGANSGDLNLESGIASSGDSGSINITVGTATGTRGTINFVDGSEGTSGHVWTSSGTAGEGNWAAPVGGATTALDNLASVDLNANLETTKASDLILRHNTETQQVKVLSADSALGGGTITGYVTVSSGNVITTGAGESGVVNVNTGYNTSAGGGGTGNLELFSGQASGSGVSGSVNLYTGPSNGGVSGNVAISTGNSAATGSGDITLQTGTAGGTRGDIILNGNNIQLSPASGASAIGEIWTATDTSGSGEWAAAPASGATTALDNLASTAINVDLLPGTTGSINLGSSSKTFNQISNRLISMYNSSDVWKGYLEGNSASLPSGDTANLVLATAAEGDGVGVFSATAFSASTSSGIANLESGNVTDAGGFTSGIVKIKSGNLTHASNNFNSGAVIISTGTVAGSGSRGTINLVDGSEGTSGHIWTSSGTSGEGNWAAAPAGGYAVVAKTTTYNPAVHNDHIFADSTGGAFTITLPATPSLGDKVRITDHIDATTGGGFATNNVTVARNSSTIDSVASDFTLDVDGGDVEFIYNGSTWRVLNLG